MTEKDHLVSLLNQAYFGEEGRADHMAWHGPSGKRALQGITAEMAVRRVLPAAHSIWEVVLHVSQWDHICVRRLQGELLTITTGDKEDWPAITTPTEEQWKLDLHQMVTCQRELVATVAKLDETRLFAQVPGWTWTYFLMIHGTLHHDLYHLGQIALLSKALLATKK